MKVEEKELIGINLLKKRCVEQDFITKDEKIAVPIYYEGYGVETLAGSLGNDNPDYIMLENGDVIDFEKSNYNIKSILHGYYYNGGAYIYTDIYVLEDM